MMLRVNCWEIQQELPLRAAPPRCKITNRTRKAPVDTVTQYSPATGARNMMIHLQDKRQWTNRMMMNDMSVKITIATRAHMKMTKMMRMTMTMTMAMVMMMTTTMAMMMMMTTMNMKMKLTLMTTGVVLQGVTMATVQMMKMKMNVDVDTGYIW